MLASSGQWRQFLYHSVMQILMAEMIQSWIARNPQNADMGQSSQGRRRGSTFSYTTVWDPAIPSSHIQFRIWIARRQVQWRKAISKWNYHFWCTFGHFNLEMLMLVYHIFLNRHFFFGLTSKLSAFTNNHPYDPYYYKKWKEWIIWFQMLLFFLIITSRKGFFVILLLSQKEQNG